MPGSQLVDWLLFPASRKDRVTAIESLSWGLPLCRVVGQFCVQDAKAQFSQIPYVEAGERVQANSVILKYVLK